MKRDGSGQKIRPLDEPEGKLRLPDHPRSPEGSSDDRGHEKPHGAPGSSNGSGPLLRRSVKPFVAERDLSESGVGLAA